MTFTKPADLPSNVLQRLGEQGIIGLIHNGIHCDPVTGQKYCVFEGYNIPYIEVGETKNG